MKAAVCRAFGQPLVIEDIEIAPPRPGEIKVKVAACAICHSDIHFMEVLGVVLGEVSVLCAPRLHSFVVRDAVQSTGPGAHNDPPDIFPDHPM